MDDQEEWRPVVGYEGRYEVSSRGRVRSLWFRNGRVSRPRSEPLIMKISGNSDAYQQVQFGHRGPQPLVHILVLEAFVGPRPPGKEGAHADGRCGNNRLSNLRWATPVENAKDKKAHGTHLEGEMVGTAKLTEAQARHALQSKESSGKLARSLGVTPGTIKHIRARRNWKHV